MKETKLYRLLEQAVHSNLTFRVTIIKALPFSITKTTVGKSTRKHESRVKRKICASKAFDGISFGEIDKIDFGTILVHIFIGNVLFAFESSILQ